MINRLFLELVDGVKAKDAVAIIQALGDISELQQELNAFFDVTDVVDIMREPLNFENLGRLSNVASGMTEFLNSPSGKKFVLTVLKKLGVKADNKLLNKVFTRIGILQKIKLVTDGVV